MSEVDKAKVPRTRFPTPNKIAWIAGIALATLVPTLLVSQLAGEREDRASAVTQEIASAWGPAQVVGAPILVLPVTTKNGATRYLSLAPRALDVKAAVTPSTRKRGLFATTVYETILTVSGRFELPESFRDGGPDGASPGQARMLESLTGIRGVEDEDHVVIGDVKSAWQACTNLAGDESACRQDPGLLAVAVDLSKVAGTDLPFNLVLHLRGTQSLRIAAAAKHTTIRIGGPWPNPSFVGSDLPTHAKVEASGFEASWTVDRLGRPAYSQSALPARIDEKVATVGVELIEAAPLYRTINRVTKYSLLIVVLAFAAYFLLETAGGVRVAPVQYAMLGASVSLFTLLLLSFSEIIGYPAGYAIGAFMVTAQASLYTLAVTRRRRAATGFAGMLAGVFGFFYVLVGLESYALVLGAVALFVVLTIVMIVVETVVGDRHAAVASAIETAEAK